MISTKEIQQDASHQWQTLASQCLKPGIIVPVMAVAICGGFAWLKLDIVTSETGIGGDLIEIRDEIRNDLTEIKEDIAKITDNVEAIKVDLGKATVKIENLDKNVSELKEEFREFKRQ